MRTKGGVEDMMRIWRAIGLMSGTSLDGIDVALIETDGERVTAFGPASTSPYGGVLRQRIADVLRAEERTEEITSLERDLTDANADAVDAFLRENGIEHGSVDLIGYHGQTINHRPDLGWTWQLGDGARLAEKTGIACVFDLRGADVAAGGQGAPLAPVYHRALSSEIEMPVCVLNLGGVANVTYLPSPESGPIAFDTGPASAMLDDWISGRGAGDCDLDGSISARGTVDQAVLSVMMDNPYFSAPYPKSLDRNDFDSGPIGELSLADGAATLAAFTVESVSVGIELLPANPVQVLVTGGGRHNPTLIKGLERRLGLPVRSVESVGWNGDQLEAQAFAFMAVRSRLDLPISFPGTTGVSLAMSGGRFAEA